MVRPNGSIVRPTTVSRDLARDRRRRPTEPFADRVQRVTAAQPETDLLPFGKGESSRAG
jgi:hypothetical protein